MGRVSIGNTNVGLYNPLSLLIGGVGGTYPMSYIRDLTWPTQTTPANVGDYAQASGQFLYQILARSNNGSWGSVSIVSPWSQTSSGTDYIGVNRQAYSYVYDYITLTATATYPRTFARWDIEGGGTYTTSQTFDLYFFNSPIINNNNLVAIFQ